MRRLHTSWTKTLTSLGFKRVFKKRRKQRQGRSSRIENLEPRQMLTGSPGTDLLPEYVLAGWAADDSPEQFVVSTEYDANDNPSAVITLAPGYEDADLDKSLQQLTLELRQEVDGAEQTLSSQEVLIDIADSGFVGAYREDRYATAYESITLPSEVDATAWLTQLNADGSFTDLVGNTDEAEQSINRLTSLHRYELELAAEPFTDLQRTHLYDAAARAANLLPAADPAAEGISAAQESVNRLALLLGSQWQEDSESTDVDLQASATGVRDTLFDLSDTSHTLFAGYGRNREVVHVQATAEQDEYVLGFIEEASYQLHDVVRFELDGYMSMVQTTLFAPTIAATARHLDPENESLQAFTVVEGVQYGENNPVNLSADIVVDGSSGSGSEAVVLVDPNWSAHDIRVIETATLKLTAKQDTNFTAATQVLDVRGGRGSQDPWDEPTAQSWAGSWSPTYSSDFEPLGNVDGTNDHVSIPNLTGSKAVVSFDVTEILQRKKLFGDADLSGEIDFQQFNDDAEAFYSAITDWASYESQYLNQTLVANELLYRVDGNWDGSVDYAGDAGLFFASYGTTASDVNADGKTDGKDYSILEANYRQAANQFGDGDSDFDGVVSNFDMDLYTANAPHQDYAWEEIFLQFRIRNQSGDAVSFHSPVEADPLQGIVSTLEITTPQQTQFLAFDTDLNTAVSEHQLRVEYRNVIADQTGMTLKIEQVFSDGTPSHTVVDSYPLPGAKSVGSNHSVFIDLDDTTIGNHYGLVDPEADYQLKATIVDEFGLSISRFLSHGIFVDAGDNLHVRGSQVEDVLLFDNNSLTYSFRDNDILSPDGAITVPTDANVYVQLEQGDDTLIVATHGQFSLFVDGGRGDDTYDLAAVNPTTPNRTVTIDDPSGLNTLFHDLGSLSLDLDSTEIQTLNHPDGTMLSLQLGSSGVIDLIESPTTANVSGEGYTRPITVTSLDTIDDGNFTFGERSLREALKLAKQIGGRPQINFHPSLFQTGPQTIDLDELGFGSDYATITLDHDVDIIGPGADLLTISGSESVRILNVESGADVLISGVTLANGYKSGGDLTGSGGAIRNEGNLVLDKVVFESNEAKYGGALYHHDGSLTVTNSTFRDNSGSFGGAVRVFSKNSGPIEITGNTFEGNRAENHTSAGGGGLFVAGGSTSGDVLIANNTFSGNSAKRYGGGIAQVGNSDIRYVNNTIAYNDTISGHTGGMFVNGSADGIYNNLIVHNTANTIYGHGDFDSDANRAFKTAALTESHNSIGDASVNLLPLDDYGGLTRTHMLGEGSTAIDTGDGSFAVGIDGIAALAADQRGIERTLIGDIYQTTSKIIDIGAIEYINPENESPLLSTLGLQVLPGDSVIITPSILSLIDPDDATANITLRIIEAPANSQLVDTDSSSQLQDNDDVPATHIEQSLLEYTHSDLATSSDYFVVEAFDQKGGISTRLRVNVDVNYDLAIYGSNDAERFDIHADRVEIGPVGSTAIDRTITFGSHPLTSVNVFARGGNDEITFHGDPSIPVNAYGEEGDDVLSPGFGETLLSGGVGDDEYRITGDVENNLARGRNTIVELSGEGADRLDFSLLTTSSGIVFDLSADFDQPIVKSSGADFVTLAGLADAAIENVHGTDQDDVIAGNALPNLIEGLGGSDRLYGLAGDDVVDGGAGDDEIHGGSGQDDLIGGTGFDNFEQAASTSFDPTFITTTHSNALDGNYSSAPGTSAAPADIAEWAFDSLPTTDVDAYELFVSWPDLPEIAAASNAKFTIKQLNTSGTQIGIDHVIIVDQTEAPQGERLADRPWQSLGWVVPESSMDKVVVELTTDGANGIVLVDGVRIEAVSTAVPTSQVNGTIFEDLNGDGFQSLDLSSALETGVAHFVFVLDGSTQVGNLWDGNAINHAYSAIFALERWLDARLEDGSLIEAKISLVVHSAENNSDYGQPAETGPSPSVAALLDMSNDKAGGSGEDVGFLYAADPLQSSFGIGSLGVDSDLAALLAHRVHYSETTHTPAVDLLERVDALFTHIDSDNNATWNDAASRHVFTFGGAFAEGEATSTVADKAALRNNSARLSSKHRAKIHGFDLNRVDADAADNKNAISTMMLIDPATRRLGTTSDLSGLQRSIASNAMAEKPLEDRVVFEDANASGSRASRDLFVYTTEIGHYQLDTTTDGVDDFTLEVGLQSPASSEFTTGSSATPFVIPSGAVERGLDIGVTNGGSLFTSIAGFKYHDINGNGRRDGGVVAADTERVALVVDISGSTSRQFLGGIPVPDLDRDGVANTILDAELAATFDLIDYLHNVNNARQAQDADEYVSLSILLFAAGAEHASVNIFDHTYHTSTDRDIYLTGVKNNLVDTVIATLEFNAVSYLCTFDPSVQGGCEHFTPEDGPFSGRTDYELALFETQFTNIANDTKNVVLFLSDGAPNAPSADSRWYADELSAVASYADIYAFGVGDLASKAVLDGIDKDANATVYHRTDALREALLGAEGHRYSEDGIGNWTIYLYADADDDGVLDAEERITPVATAITDEEGAYEFAGLDAGTYFVAEQQLSGFNQTGPAGELPYLLQLFSDSGTPGADKATVNSTNPDDLYYKIALEENERAPLVNFGNELVEQPKPNAAPQWTSTPGGTVEAGKQYTYKMTATDEEGDAILFPFSKAEIAWPEDYTPAAEYDFVFNDTSNTITWNPDPSLAGKTIRFTERVNDALGNVGETREHTIEITGVTHPPEVWAFPDTSFTTPGMLGNYLPDSRVKPGFLHLTLGPGEQTTETLTLVDRNVNLDSQIVFVLDSSGSMQDGFNWLSNSIDAIDYELSNSGFATREYGLVLFRQDAFPYDFDESSNGVRLWGTKDDIAEALLAFPTVPGPISGNDEAGYNGLNAVFSHPSGPNEDTYEFTRGISSSSQIVLITDDYETVAPTDQPGRALEREKLLKRFLGLAPLDDLSDPSLVDPFDDVIMSVLAPHVITATLDNEIEGFVTEGDTWRVQDGSLTGTASSSRDAGLAYYHPVNLGEHDTRFSTTLTLQDNSEPFVAFNVKDAGTFSYVSTDIISNTWEFGSISTDTNGVQHREVRESVSATNDLSFGQDYDIVVEYVNSSYYISIRDASASYNYLPPIYDSEPAMGIGVGAFDGIVSARSLSLELSTPTDGRPNRFYVLDRDFSNARSLESVGFDSFGRAYSVGSVGAPIELSNPSVTWSVGDSSVDDYSTVEADYINLALATGGSAWDYGMLRKHDLDINDKGDGVTTYSESLAEAFARSLVLQAAANTEVLQASSSSPLLVGAEASDESTTSIDVTFEGDGNGHVLNVLIEDISAILDNDPGGEAQLKASVPVYVSSKYFVDLLANDLDGGHLTFSLIEDGNEFWSNFPKANQPKLIDTDINDDRTDDRLVWNPPADAEGEYHFWVTVEDESEQRADRPFDWSVTVSPPSPNEHAPTVVSITPNDGINPLEPVSVQAERAVKLRVNGTDADGDKVRYALVDDYNGAVSIDPFSGDIDWVPRRQDIGQIVTLDVIVNDGRLIQQGKIDTTVAAEDYDVLVPSQSVHSFDVEVVARDYGNFIPAWSQIDDRHITAGNKVVIPLRGLASDADGDPISYRVANAPDGLLLTDDDTLIWTPSVKQAGDDGQAYNIALEADDGNLGMARTSVSIYVTPPNRAPVITFPETYPFDPAYDMEIPFSVYDKDGDTITADLVTLVEGPEWLVLEQDPETYGLWYLRGSKASLPVGGVVDALFTIRVEDGFGEEDSATRYLNIAPDTGALTPLVAPASSGGMDSVAPAGELYRSPIEVRSFVNRNLTTDEFTLDRIADITEQLVALGVEDITVDTTNMVRIVSAPSSSDPNIAVVTYSNIDVVWTPSVSDVGEQSLRVVVFDGSDATLSESDLYSVLDFTVLVTPPVNTGEPPQLTSSIPGFALIGDANPWGFDVTGTDDVSAQTAVAWELIKYPANYDGSTSGTLGSGQNTIQWSPTTQETGENEFVLKLTDDDENFVRYQFFVTADTVAGGTTPAVADQQLPPQNSKPVFATGHLPDTAVGIVQTVRIFATDDDGHTITYRFAAGATLPLGMTAASLSSDGLLQWVPQEGAAGNYEIMVEAVDARGDVTPATLPLRIDPNAQPRFTQPEPSPIYEGLAWTYTFTADDADGDEIFVKLNDEATALGMRLVKPLDPASNEWKVVWDEPRSVGDLVKLEIDVTDNRTKVFTLQFGRLMEVRDSNTADDFISLSDGTEISVPIGSSYSIDLSATKADGSGVVWSLVNSASAPDGLILDESGSLSFTPTLSTPAIQVTRFQEARHTVEIASDDGALITLDFIVTPPGETNGTTPTLVGGPTTQKYVVAGGSFDYKPTVAGGLYTEGLNWDVEGLPASRVEEFLFSNDSGRLVFDPEVSDIGTTFTYTIRAVDIFDRVATQEVLVTVLSAASLPTINTMFPKQWKLGEPLKVELDVSSPDDDNLILEVVDANGVTAKNVSFDGKYLEWASPVPHTPLTLRVAKESSPEQYATRTILLDSLVASSPVDSFGDDYPALFVANAPGRTDAAIGVQFAYDFALEGRTLGAFDRDLTYELLTVDTVPLGTYLSQFANTSGPHISFVDGLFNWTPTNSEAGLRTFEIKVSNSSDSSQNTTRSFSIEANRSAPPEILSVNTRDTIAGADFFHQFIATDPDGSTPRFRINNEDALPEGSDIYLHPTSGELRWRVPRDLDVGTSVDIEIEVSDGEGGLTPHTLSVTTVLDNEAPTLNFYLTGPDGEVVHPGNEIDGAKSQEYVAWFELRDNAGIDGISWTLDAYDGSVVNTPENSVIDGASGIAGGLWSAQIDPDSLSVTEGFSQGYLTYKLDFTDGTNSDVREFTYYVNDPDSANTAKIGAIPEDAVFDIRTDVFGVANFSDGSVVGNYSVTLIPVDDPDGGITIVNNRQANIDATTINTPIAVIDPTLLASGLYRMYLEVRCDSGCIEAIDEQIIEIRNDSRLGNLDLSFTDLQANLGGVPVSLSRSYSSARSDLLGSTGGDLGAGWEMGLFQSGVQIAHPEQVTTQLGQAIAAGTRINVTLPNGAIERFTFDPELVGSENEGLYRVRFRTLADSTMDLSVVGEPDGLLLRRNEIRNDGTFLIADSGHSYSLDAIGKSLEVTQTGGTAYRYGLRAERLGELIGIADLNGNEVQLVKTIHEAPSQYSQEVSIRTVAQGTQSTEEMIVLWNQDGQIAEAIDPINAVEYRLGNAYEKVTYSYDTSGPVLLDQVSTRTSSNTNYVYGLSEFPAYLTKIQDHLDTDVLTASYYTQQDADTDLDITDEQVGRLKDLTDAGGNASSVTFDLELGGGKKLTTVSVGTQVIQEVQDSRGNTLRRIEPLGSDRYLVTLYAYEDFTDSAGNRESRLIRQSLPFIAENSADRLDFAPGDPDVNPEAWASIIKYDLEGRVDQSTDAYGAVTTYVYDDNDRVIKTIDPRGIATHNVYNSYSGDLLETYSISLEEPDQKFNHTRFEYRRGRVVATYQVDGNREILVSRTEYDSYGRVLWTEDGNQVRRYLGYDANGRQDLSWSTWFDPQDVTRSVVTVSKTIYDADDRVEGSEQYEIVQAITPGATEIASAATIRSMLSSETPLSQTTTFYDGLGRVEKTLDRNGAESFSLYDARGNVVETRSTAINENDQQGWLVSRTLYDDQGRVIFATDPYFVVDLASTSSDDYDPATTDVPTLGTHTEYDTLGRTVATRRFDNVTITLTQTPGKEIYAAGSIFDFNITPISESTTEYDDYGRVLYTVTESDARTDYYYDYAGRQIAVLGPVVEVVNGVAVNGVDTRHLTLSVFNPAGQLTQSLANLAVVGFGTNLHPDLEFVGNRVQGIDALLVDNSSIEYTYYEYDAAGRQTATVTTLVDHDKDNTTDEVHLRSETHFDNLGRRVRTVTGITQATPFTTDRDYTDARTTDYEHDDQGNLTAVIMPTIAHPTITGLDVRPRYEYTYDKYGNRLTIRDNIYQSGEDVFYTPGAANDFSAVGDTRVTEFAYDHRGSQISRTLPLGHTNGSGFTETMVYRTTEDSTLAGLEAGQLEYMVDFEGRVTAHRYDNTATVGGRLVQKLSFANLSDYNLYVGSGTPSEVYESVSYKYDAFGREKEVVIDRDVAATTDAVHTTTRDYDVEGRLTSVTSPEGTINYAYDAVTGWLVGTSTDHTDKTFLRDSLGRIKQLSVTQRDIHNGTAYEDTLDGEIPEVTRYGYDVQDRLDWEETPAGTTRDLAYDELGRVTQIDHFEDTDNNRQLDPGEAQIASFDYAYTLHSQQASLTEEFYNTSNGNLDKTLNYKWTYDDLGRLKEEVFDLDNNGDSAGDYVDGFSHDLVGNRIEKRKYYDTTTIGGTHDKTTYDYDENDRLLSESYDASDPADDSNTVYQYGDSTTIDPNGDYTIQTNKITKSGAVVGQGSLEESQTFEYNLQGRLTKVETTETGSAAVVTEYEYNDDGIRISQKVDGTKTVYLVDANNATGYAQVLEEHDDTGNVTKTYTIGLDVATQATAAAVYHLLYDAHGSTRVLLDSDGNVAQRFAYDAYGERLDLSDFAGALTTALTTLLYSGEQTDGSTGLQYLRARYYDAGSGRFNRLDPFAGNFSDPLSLHKYGYVHGDPINGIDPSGLFFVGVGVGIGRFQAAAAKAGVALGALDRVTTAIDIAQVAIQVAATGTASPLQVAEIAFDLLPGSGIIKRIRKAGGFITERIGETRTISGAAQIINDMNRRGAIPGIGSNIYRNANGTLTKAVAVSKRRVERIGEIGGGFVARSMGFEAVNFPKKVRGIDGIFKNSDGQWMILEAKGGSSTLAKGQMSQAWLRNRIDALPAYFQKEMTKARKSGNLFGVVASTKIDKAGNVLEPTFVAKPYSQIGGASF